MTMAVPAVRSAVRTWLEKFEAGDKVLVAVSGGADSLALAHALSVEAKQLAITILGVTVDHQLQSGSAAQAETVVSQLSAMDLKCVVKKVEVKIKDGLESSARSARYKAINEVAQAENVVAVFLGHTQDDQAETVLLGLARGSGTRSLSGMAAHAGIFVRPLLGLTRETTQNYCEQTDLTFWKDPHNQDPQFARVRVRTEAIPVLEKTIGPGISEALARSSQLLREDADALDHWAEHEAMKLDLADLECDHLEAMPKAIRTRVLRMAIYAQGAPSGSITAEHVSVIEALITAWSGQGAANLPGGVKVERISGRLSLSPQRP
ncbi:MAG: tRNA lysidine(34) synthetase TilS [Streptomycetaceae bacterium]|jgi:tRNA(Ile)-lysidine synthase|nr:tRNA lysidine(34) synthetase TilS [Streptomycetaceae bacterium]